MYVLVGWCVDTCAHMSSNASHVKTEDCSSIVTLLMTPPAALLKVFYPTDIFLLFFESEQDMSRLKRKTLQAMPKALMA